MSHLTRYAAVVTSALVVSAGIQLTGALAAPDTSAPVTVTREALASARHPRGADGRTLALAGAGDGDARYDAGAAPPPRHADRVRRQRGADLPW
jgi:hypothetical protein